MSKRILALCFLTMSMVHCQDQANEDVLSVLMSYANFMKNEAACSIEYGYEQRGSDNKGRYVDLALLAPNGDFFLSSHEQGAGMEASAFVDKKFMSFNFLRKSGGIPNKKGSKEISEYSEGILPRVNYIFGTLDPTSFDHPICSAFSYTTVYSRFVRPVSGVDTVYSRYCDAFDHQLLVEVSKNLVVSERGPGFVKLELSKEIIKKFPLQFYSARFESLNIDSKKVWRCSEVKYGPYWKALRVNLKGLPISRESILKSLYTIKLKYKYIDGLRSSYVLPNVIEYYSSGEQEHFFKYTRISLEKIDSETMRDTLEASVLEMSEIAEWFDPSKKPAKD